MNTHLKDLFDHNRAWAAQMVAEKPNFFTDLLAQQSPRYMWIGCSDSRVPANQITGLAPGEVFVHRNVANVVVPTDLNCLSTIQYAVDMLKVEHLMVVGHYGCGGVQAALNDARVGLADNWLRHIKDVRDRHGALLERLPAAVRHDALCELNVIEQVMNVVQTTVLQDAWGRGQTIALHGWVYGLRDGLLHDLLMTVNGTAGVDAAYRAAVAAVATRRGL
jgi:carbonic anhydrase